MIGAGRRFHWMSAEKLLHVAATGFQQLRFQLRVPSVRVRCPFQSQRRQSFAPRRGPGAGLPLPFRSFHKMLTQRLLFGGSPLGGVPSWSAFFEHLLFGAPLLGGRPFAGVARRESLRPQTLPTSVPSRARQFASSSTCSVAPSRTQLDIAVGALVDPDLCRTDASCFRSSSTADRLHVPSGANYETRVL